MKLFQNMLHSAIQFLSCCIRRKVKNELNSTTQQELQMLFIDKLSYAVMKTMKQKWIMIQKIILKKHFIMCMSKVWVWIFLFESERISNEFPGFYEVLEITKTQKNLQRSDIPPLYMKSLASEIKWK